MALELNNRTEEIIGSVTTLDLSATNAGLSVLTSVADDATPQLGGDLDVDGNDIIGAPGTTTAGDLNLIGGAASTGDGGHVNVTGGTGTGGRGGDVVLSSGVGTGGKSGEPGFISFEIAGTEMLQIEDDDTTTRMTVPTGLEFDFEADDIEIVTRSSAGSIGMILGTGQGATSTQALPVTISAGQGGLGAGDPAGGDLTITSGRGGSGSSGPGGKLTITAGPGHFSGTGGDGGELELNSGFADGASGNGTGGELDINAGAGLGTGDGGTVNIDAGDGGTTGAGGGVNITAGEGGSTSGDGGDITLNVGERTSGTLGRVIFQSTDAGSGVGPLVSIFRNSPSPADADLIGRFSFSGINDNSEIIEYAYLQATINDTTDGVEDASLLIATYHEGEINGSFLLLNGPSVTIAHDDDDATLGPIFRLQRYSASPAASDIIGSLRFNGEDSAANEETYAEIEATIIDPTTTAEDGRAEYRVKVAGAMVPHIAMEGNEVDIPTGVQLVADDGVQMVSNTGPTWSSGAGTPEGAVTAPVGSLFTRTDGGASTTLYVKESGAGNTGWVAK